MHSSAGRQPDTVLLYLREKRCSSFQGDEHTIKHRNNVLPMMLGITFDLRAEYLSQGLSEEETAEFDRIDTIEAIEQALIALGHEVDRIGSIKAVASRLVKGDRWDLVFNIAEGLRGFGREAQVPSLLEAFNIPYTFSDPLVLALTLHKGIAKHVLRDIGVPTPDFVVVEKEADLSRIRLPLPLFVKPVAEGTGKGISSNSKIDHYDQLEPICQYLLTKYQQPVLVETYLPGREFTVGIVGTGDRAQCLGVAEVALRSGAESHAYSYVNKEQCEELIDYRLVTDAEKRLQLQTVALQAWRGLGCRDAGRVDLREDAQGNPQVMEINPLAGLHPEHSDLCIIATLIGMPYVRLIEAILQSAWLRGAHEDTTKPDDVRIGGFNLRDLD